MSLLLGEQEGQDVRKGRMFVGADVIATNQSWMLSAGGSGGSAWEEASVSQPRGWPEEHAALISSLITQHMASQPPPAGFVWSAGGRGHLPGVHGPGSV